MYSSSIGKGKLWVQKTLLSMTTVIRCRLDITVLVSVSSSNKYRSIYINTSLKNTRTTNLSHWRRVHEAIIHKDTMKTNNTVPGQIVIKVLRTNFVLKFIRFSAPILRDDASVNN